MPQAELTAAQEWKRHWTLVLAAGIGFSLVSLMTPAQGVFMKPMLAEFHWTRDQFYSGSSYAGLFGVIFASFVGMGIDRWGTRRLAIPGLLLVSGAIAGFSLANGSASQWILLWLFFGGFGLLVQSSVWSTAVAGVFSAGRGLALGLTMSGTALAQVIAPPLATYLIHDHGWRAAFIWIAVGWGGLALILALFFLYDAYNLRINVQKGPSTPENKAAAAAARALLPGLTIPQAWRSTELWRIGVATFLILVITIAVSSQQVPILQAIGLSDTSAAWMAGLTGVAGITGKLVTGALIDKFHARWVGGITLASTAIAYPLMMATINIPALAKIGLTAQVLIVIGIVISGYAAGTKIQLCSYLTARYAGIRNYGAIFGFMASIIALASVVGPRLAAISFDMYKSYGPFLIIGVAVSIISGGLIFSLPRYPNWNAADAGSSAAEAVPA